LRGAFLFLWGQCENLHSLQDEKRFLAGFSRCLYVQQYSENSNDTQGRRDWGVGGQEGQPPPLPFTRRGKGGKGALSMPWRNRELSEMLVQFFYEFASENARNAVIELQE
jgi:hypothetical protein